MKKKQFFLICAVICSLLFMSSMAQAQDRCTDATGGSIPCPKDKDDDSTPSLPDGPADSDGDGVADVDDGCPNVGGPLSTGGCPEDTTQSEDTSNPAPTPVPTQQIALPTLPTDQGCVLATQTNALVNVRQEPSLNSEIVGVLQPLQIYAVVFSTVNDEGTWYLVEGIAGWVFADVVRLAGECHFIPRTLGGFIRVPDIGGESTEDPNGTRFKLAPSDDDPTPFDIFINFDGGIDVELPDGSPHTLQIAPYGGDPLPPDIDWIAILPDEPDTPALMVIALPDDSGMTIEDLTSAPDPEKLEGDWNGDGEVGFPDFLILSAADRPAMVVGNLAGVLALSPKFLHIPSLPLADSPEIIADGEIGCFLMKEVDDGDIKVTSKVSLSGLVIPLQGPFTAINISHMIVGKGTNISFDVVADNGVTRGALSLSPYGHPPQGMVDVVLPDTAVITTDSFEHSNQKDTRIYYAIDEAVGTDMTATLVCN